jgi:hypothetical protein
MFPADVELHVAPESSLYPLTAVSVMLYAPGFIVTNTPELDPAKDVCDGLDALTFAVKLDGVAEPPLLLATVVRTSSVPVVGGGTATTLAAGQTWLPMKLKMLCMSAEVGATK